MYAVYVREDMWRLLATFSTSDAANFLVVRLVGRGVRAKVFRYASAPASTSATREMGGKHGQPV
jgi:hypothetical protein